jgi:hypothetical protein
MTGQSKRSIKRNVKNRFLISQAPKGPPSLPSDDDPVSLQPDRDFAAWQSASWMGCKSRQSIVERLNPRYPCLFHNVQQPQHAVALYVLATGHLPNAHSYRLLYRTEKSSPSGWQTGVIRAANCFSNRLNRRKICCTRLALRGLSVLAGQQRLLL